MPTLVLSKEEAEADPCSEDPSSQRPTPALTRVGAVMGTVGYMAPEQVRGQVADSRSDQFSFCVALWEALHGKPPFSIKSFQRYRDAVLNVGPWHPESTEVPTWLRTVLARGLAVEPSERWSSMDELLAALDNDPTRGRRRWATALGGVGLVLGLGTAAWFYNLRASEARVQTCVARSPVLEHIWAPPVVSALEQSFARTDSPIAAAAWASALPWLERYAHGLGSMRRTSCEEVWADKTRSEASGAAVLDCLDERQASFAALLEVFADADAALVQHAGEAASSLPLLSQCTDETHLARTLRPPPRLREATKGLRRRLHEVEARRLLGDLEPALLEAEIVLDEAEQIGWDPITAEAQLVVAQIRYELGEYEDTIVLGVRSFRKAATGGDTLQMLEAAVYLTRAGARMAQFEMVDAWSETAEDLIANEELEDSPLAGQLSLHRSKASLMRGEAERAELEARRGVTILEAQHGSEHPQVALALTALAVALDTHGKPDEALAVFERHVELLERSLGPDNVLLISGLNNLGAFHHFHGDVELAMQYYRRGLQAAELNLGPEHHKVGILLSNLGMLAASEGEDEDAIAHYERAIATLEVATGPEHPDMIPTLVHLAELRSRRGEHDQAFALFRRVLGIAESSGTSLSKAAIEARLSYATVLAKAGKLDEARAEFGITLGIMEAQEDTNLLLVVCLRRLGELELELGQLELAGQHLTRSASLAEQREQPAPHAQAIFALARLALARGDRGRGREQAQAARAELEAQDGSEETINAIDEWLAGLGSD